MSTKETDSHLFKIDPELSGERIDKFLSKNLEDVSRSRIQKLITEGKVLVNGARVSKNHRLVCGQEISIEDLSSINTSSNITAEEIDLKIIYEDKSILVISKDAGMLTHPAPGNENHTLVNALMYHCKNLSKLSGEERAGIVHRLDKDTSGLLITAKDENVHHRLSEMFAERKVKKTYIALAEGRFKEDKGEIKLPIGRSRIDRKKMSVAIDNGREAVTAFEVAEEFRQATLLNVYPRTGRTHQIRVHLNYIGHPIIADQVYGSRFSAKIAKKIGLERQFLHASKLEFIHPVTEKLMEFEDPIPQDLSESLEKLREGEKMQTKR
ncbi:MAG: RluA family pseudouridine synthase [Actinobacteria bacterium]|nr:RluA family pseudouridine synthase [Actinomycetota bacterium]